ncbi:ribonuclease H-like domain-containing protein [Tanacetum coccineum]|uniref:Ribonuclease H-like domain-containing protein n=1 Tax=Tanacetum coccineum TaxID=301880 RepID=A0ABQ5CDH6_9ASTR
MPPLFYPTTTSTQIPPFRTSFHPSSTFASLDKSLWIENPPRPQVHSCPHCQRTKTIVINLEDEIRPNDNGNRRTTGGSTLVCENCGFNGHSINKCFKIIGYPADFGKRKDGSNLKGKNVSNNVVGFSSSNEFSDKQMATLISLIKYNFVNGKGVHSNMAGTYMNSSTVFNKNFEKLFCSNSSLDSKLGSKGLITDSVTRPNGTEAFITRIGNMLVTDYLILYDVLVVPKYRVSLMSLHKVARESKLVIAFDEMHCYVMNQDLRKGKILGDWLGIADLVILDHVSTELGELVHLDLWGPYKVTSREGFKFFLTIVDDFSRAVWVYLLKSKTEVFHNIMVFYNLIKTQFKKNIKVFRSDNGTEFVNQQFYGFSKSNGIVHQTSCRYTPQQNGIVERKHRHLLNVARFLLFQGGILLNIWSEFFLTATYLITRLHTSVMNGKSPYDLVYNKPHSLNHLRSFGCLAYATILNCHDKFGSRDVKFFEDIFPFKQNNLTGIDNSVQDNDAGHSQDADDSASENGSFAADKENNSNSEGIGLHDQSHDNVDAMNAEMDALYRNNTWEIVDLPVRRKVIGSKWVWKIKYKFDEEIERYKARLVAKGFNQIEGIDFDETFSPVVKIVTVRCLINLDVQNGWSLFQMDINNAFLYGDLEETVYMALPPGYFPDNKTKVCKLNKSLYGLKQALRKWNAKLTSALLENNFMQSKSDYSLFTKSFDDVFIALLVYVDDIIITGNSLTEIEKVKQFLKTKFMIKDLGKLKYFLGIEVVDTPKGICLNQRKYCLELIDEFGLLARKPSNLRMQPNISLTSEQSDTKPLLDNGTEYQNLIGKLIYLTTTRPDIAYTVSYFSQFMHNPLRSHLKTALKVIRYLKGSLGKGINMIKGSAFSIDLKAYSNSDWARCADTRRSITGYCVFMCGSLVSWKSKKQKTISKSSTKVEYRSLASVTSEVIWILKILKDLKCFNLLPVKVFCDSNSAIKIASNPIFHERTKH